MGAVDWKGRAMLVNLQGLYALVLDCVGERMPRRLETVLLGLLSRFGLPLDVCHHHSPFIDCN